jgi:hypothetical protein
MPQQAMVMIIFSRDILSVLVFCFGLEFSDRKVSAEKSGQKNGDGKRLRTKVGHDVSDDDGFGNGHPALHFLELLGEIKKLDISLNI